MKGFFQGLVRNGICPHVRAYATHYSFEDCVGLLCRKNAYDTFEYRFFWREAYFIQLNEPLIPRTLDMRFCKGSVYLIEFERRESGTRFVVRFDHITWLPDGGPYISQTLLDSFFRTKLDAKPCWPEY